MNAFRLGLILGAIFVARAMNSVLEVEDGISVVDDAVTEVENSVPEDDKYAYLKVIQVANEINIDEHCQGKNELTEQDVKSLKKHIITSYLLGFQEEPSAHVAIIGKNIPKEKNQRLMNAKNHLHELILYLKSIGYLSNLDLIKIIYLFADQIKYNYAQYKLRLNRFDCGKTKNSQKKTNTFSSGKIDSIIKNLMTKVKRIQMKIKFNEMRVKSVQFFSKSKNTDMDKCSQHENNDENSQVQNVKQSEQEIKANAETTQLKKFTELFTTTFDEITSLSETKDITEIRAISKTLLQYYIAFDLYRKDQINQIDNLKTEFKRLYGEKKEKKDKKEKTLLSIDLAVFIIYLNGLEDNKFIDGNLDMEIENE